MGVTIHYHLSLQKMYVKDALDMAERAARFIQEERAKNEGVKFSIRRDDDYTLAVDSAGCETLLFQFKTPREWKADRDQFEYEYILREMGKVSKKTNCLELDEGYEYKTYPQNEKTYAIGFCKTQYGEIGLQHKWIADILRIVAGRCEIAEVHDEGEYYHSGKLDDAIASIKENGKMIDGMLGLFEKAGWTKDEITKGETKIK